MGNGVIFGRRKRYMGGKTLQKFFIEDILPIMEHLFDRLHISEGKAFELFRHFAFMDSNENGVVDNQELLRYLHVQANRFTERIFYHELTDEDDDMMNLMNQHGPGGLEQAGINVNKLKRIAVTYREFVIFYWHFCTLSVDQIARYIFEIFDLDNNLFLHRNYLITIFKLLNNTDEDPDKDYYAFYPCIVRYQHEKQGAVNFVSAAATNSNKPQSNKTSNKHDEAPTSRKKRRKKLSHKSSRKSNSGGEEYEDKEIHPSSHRHHRYHDHDHLSEDDEEEDDDEEDEGVPIEEFTKSSFMESSVSNPILIQPALNFQLKLRKRIGGKMFWESLMHYRKRQFKGYDEQSETLHESLEAILQSAEDMKLKKLNNTTEKILQSKLEKIQYEKELAERELVLNERQKEAEARTQELYGKDRPMKIAWAIFEEKKAAFEKEEFTLDDIWRRREWREELYHLLDDAIEISKEYHAFNDERELKVAEGIDLDHEARYQDYLKTEEGKKLHDFYLVYHVFNHMLKEIQKKNRKNKRYDETKKSNLQLVVETNMMELVKVYDQTKQNYHLTNKMERDRAIKAFCRREFTEELKTAKKYAKKADFTYAEDTSHQELLNDLKEKTIREANETVNKAKEEREKDYVRKGFEIASNFGSRITRWEKVLDKEVNRLLYINVDTLETKHPKTAICENCDAIMVQNELKCDNCTAPRSAFNMKLYRPLGFKDITLE